MLDTNRLLPPRQFSPHRRAASAGTAHAPAAGRGSRFVSAEDFDATGILTGVDLCASSYWWIPELHDCADACDLGATVTTLDHATARTSSRTTAAA